MSIARENIRPAAPLPLTDGTAAFDPTTLSLAASRLTAKGFRVNLPAALIGRPSPALRRYAAVSCGRTPTGVVAVCAEIDTGRMRWAAHHSAERESFTDYTGADRRAVELVQARVAEVDGVRIARMDMDAPGGEEISLWAAELPSPGDVPCSVLALTESVSRWQRGFASDGARQRWITVPSLDTECFADASDVAQSADLGCTIQQTIRVRIDEHGAEANAMTVMCTSVPDFDDIQTEPIAFGTRGPVITWFTGEDGADAMPFAIVVAEADAWQRA